MLDQTDIASFFCPTKIFIGTGSYKKLAEILPRYECKRLMIVLDTALKNSEYFKQINHLINSMGIDTAVYSDVEPDPSSELVEKALQICVSHEATALLAVGGGSTIDIAKAVGILSTNGGRIHDYEGIEKFSIPPLPLIAIPTTAGTGSEVSGSCVITDEETGLKMSVRHASLNPARIAILDPLALSTVPAHVAAHAGIDAFVHAYESYISLKSNLVTDALNIQAINLITRSIRQFVANRSNLQAGMDMLCGSTLAGITFGQTGLGNVHCIARFIGAFFGLSHGLSNGLCLPHVARFNMIANYDKYANIGLAMGLHVQGFTRLESAQAAIDGIDNLCKDLGIPLRMRDAGVTSDKFDQIAQLCTEANYDRWNPRTTSTKDFKQLLESAY